MTTPESFSGTSARYTAEAIASPGESGPGPGLKRRRRGIPVPADSALHRNFWTRDVAEHPLWLTLGFTLVELLIVIAIIGALLAIAIPNYYKSIEKAKMTKIISEMKLLEKEILIYAIDNPGFPETLADIGRDNYLDPYGNPYQYLNMATAKGNGKKRKDHNQVPINSDFDLYSMGPDGKSASPLTAQSSYDDIIRGSNGAYFGPAWAY
jgi:general secretion pathway protein G